MKFSAALFAIGASAAVAQWGNETVAYTTEVVTKLTTYVRFSATA